MPLKSLYCWCLLLLVALQGVARAEADDDHARPGWAMFHDRSGTLGIDDVLQPEIAAQFVQREGHPRLGYRQGAVWLRVTLERPRPNVAVWWLGLQNPTLDSVTLYQPLPEGGLRLTRAGDREAWPGRDVEFHSPLFRVEIPAAQALTVHLRIAGFGPQSFALMLWTPERFVADAARLQLLHGLIFAALLLLMLSNLWLYAATGDGTFGLFSAFTLANMLTMLGAEGYLYQYLLREQPRLNEWLFVLSWLWATPLGLAFVSRYLRLREVAALARAVNWGLLLAVGVALAASFIVPLPAGHALRPLYQLWNLSCILLALLVSSWMSHRGLRRARVLSGILLVFLATLLLRVLRNLGMLESGLLVDNAYYFGMLAYALVVSSAVSRSYENLRQEKAAVQARALALAQQHERRLEEEVAKRTRALAATVTQAELALDLERHARDEQRQFLATVSHELRTPLAVIDTTAQNLELDAEGCPAQARERYRKILRATERMTQLLNGALDEQRFELLRRGSHLRQVPLAPLLEDAARAASLLGDGHRFEVDAGQLPASVRCDPDLLVLVLRTLADNAVKYTPPGTCVRLGGQALADRVRIDIEDDGPGIAADELPRLFEPNFRGRGAGDQPGSGLGLPLARRMLEMQGGTLEIHSAPQQGCRARLELPLGADQPSVSGRVKL